MNLILKYKKHILILALTFALLFFFGLKLGTTSTPLSSNEGKVHFINVGQGDATLIEASGINILIDAGPNNSADTVVKYLKKHKIKSLDYVIATHPHEDHIGGMDEIISNFKIKSFIAPRITADTDEFYSMIKALKAKGVSISSVEDNTILNIDEDDTLHFLYTGSNTVDENLNNYSMVVSYIHDNNIFLFTGDIEEPVERKLSASGLLSKTDVLKVSHHGSSSSSSQNFINAVMPELSIISCGMGNDYGHPNKATLDTLKQANSHILRTDINGNVIIKTDGSNLFIYEERSDR